MNKELKENSTYNMQKTKELTQAEIMRSLPNESKTDTYIVSYIDFLGTKDRLSKENQDDFFGLVYGSFKAAVKMGLLPEDREFGTLRVQTFSDNILICSRVENDSLECIEKAYIDLFNFLKFLLRPFIEEGYLFRGGLTIGELYIDPIMVWGKDLVKAVVLEEELANYPRVVVSEKLMSMLIKRFPHYDNSDELNREIYSGLVRDFDGMYYVDFIQYTNTGLIGDEITTAQKNNTRKIEEYSGREDLGSEKILQKLKWQETYLNRAMKKHKDYNALLDSTE